MSQENVEVVSASVELWCDGRMSEWIATLDADIEWDISAHPLPDFPDRGRGRAAFVAHMGGYLSGWIAYEASGKELIDRGDDVVLILHERARMPDSDMTLDRDLPTCGRFEMGEPCGFGFSRFAPKPSKPSGCGSRLRGCLSYADSPNEMRERGGS